MECIKQIAKQHLGIENLEPIGRDKDDFPEVYVSKLKSALEEAFLAGQKSALKDEFPTLSETIVRMKYEILSDVARGDISDIDQIKSFTELNELIDANEYGGFCDDGFMESLIAHFGGRDPSGGMPDEAIRYINDAQNSISGWIESGGLNDDRRVIPRHKN